jgi:FkbM family methyltransferase
VRELLARVYAFAFARPGPPQVINHVLYNLALRGQGFNNTWELDHSGEAWFVRHVLAPTSPAMCVDVGANLGDYSRMLLTETDAEVIAFEPLVECQPVLDVLAKEHEGRLVVVAEAVGAQAGVMTIHYGDKSALASLSEEVSGIGYVAEVNVRTAPVTVTTLDEHLADIPRVDFLKIDTEGFEYEVLTGAQDLLHTRRPRYVQIEMNLHQLYRGHTLHSIGALLKGYAPFQLLPRGMRPVDLDRPEANTFAYGNFVFEDMDFQHRRQSF